jgi:hypothetical protein
MRPDVALAFDRMAAAAAREGISLIVVSGYRSDAEQAALFAQHPDPRWVARRANRCTASEPSSTLSRRALTAGSTHTPASSASSSTTPGRCSGFHSRDGQPELPARPRVHVKAVGDELGGAVVVGCRKLPGGGQLPRQLLLPGDRSIRRSFRPPTPLRGVGLGNFAGTRNYRTRECERR